jgi:hypothetical protein
MIRLSSSMTININFLIQYYKETLFEVIENKEKKEYEKELRRKLEVFQLKTARANCMALERLR